MQNANVDNRLSEALNYIREKTKLRADVAFILGSGLGDFAERICGITLPYSDIPGFCPSTAPSHKGQLHIGELNGKSVIALQGRIHLYEGYSAQDIAFPVEVMHGLGVKTLIATNISGALNPDYKAGDIIGISDHIFLPGFSGHSPLTARARTPERSNFLNLTQAYDSTLLDSVNQSPDGPLKRGVYACLAGPHFETPAEGRLLRALGADMVGMSTVFETIMARHLEMKVLALSLIANPVITDAESQSVLSEDDIWNTVSLAMPHLENRLLHVLSTV